MIPYSNFSVWNLRGTSTCAFQKIEFSFFGIFRSYELLKMNEMNSHSLCHIEGMQLLFVREFIFYNELYEFIIELRRRFINFLNPTVAYSNFLVSNLRGTSTVRSKNSFFFRIFRIYELSKMNEMNSHFLCYIEGMQLLFVWEFIFWNEL